MSSSSRASNISLQESEGSFRSTRQRSKIVNQPHDTRLFAKLYVDLSRSRINFDAHSIAVPDPPAPPHCNNLVHLRRRDSDAFSENSRNSDFIDNSLDIFRPLPMPRSFVDMPRTRVCDSEQTCWKTYFCAFCAFGLLYIYIQTIHNGGNIRKLFQEVETLKGNIQSADTTSKINKLENILNNMKREQEQQRKNLKEFVLEELEKFSSDRTGMTDYALETTGGKIVNLIPGTENFDNAKTLFGITLCEGAHGPRAMIQADMSPGHCWAIRGSHGGAIIKLLGKVKINAVSLEHISENISPTGEVSSAPKEFSVWGLNSSSDRGQNLGTFTYHVKGPLVQTFPINNSNLYEYVEFRVMSNQGNPDFTCIYRFRVHGELDTSNIHL